MNKKAKKSVRLLSWMTAVMLMVSMTAASTFAYADTKTVAGDGNAKEETVYVITNADGSSKETIVSDHIYNRNSADIIEDISNLSNIKNVKGDEKFTKGSENQMTWKAAGNDIYYQGDTEREAPVSLNIKYYLDGKEISGEALQGKSGHVKMVVNYQNNQTVNLDGRTVKVPFVVMSGFMVEDDCLHNTTISSGKIIDDGEKQVIVGMSVPGLSESLGISQAQTGFSDSVTIEGDAEKFSVDSMMTVVTSSIFEDIDTSKLGELNMDDQIKELDSAAQKLVSGSTTLYDGIHMLNDKSKQLSAGVGELNTGSKELLKGVKDAKDGAEQVSAGSAAVEKYALGIQDAIDGGSQTTPVGLKTAAESVKNGINTAKTNLGLAVDASNASVDTQLTKLKTDSKITQEEYDEIVSELTKTRITSTEINSAMVGISTGADSLSKGLTSLSAQLKGTDPVKNPGLVPVSKKVSSGADSLAGALGSTTAASSASDNLYSGAYALAEGMSELSSSSNLLIKGVNSLDLGSAELNSGMEQFYKQGIEKLVNLYNSDLKGITSNLNAVVKAGKAYDTFTNLPDGMNGNVKFIYKTELTTEQ